MDDIASTTSLVNVLPTPDDPINTVGLMAWKKKGGKYKDEYIYIYVYIYTEIIKFGGSNKVCTLTASTKYLTGSCSCAQGFLKC